MPPGPGLRWGGGGVKEELVVLQRVDGTGDVAHEGLGLSGRHGPGEAAALQEEGRKGGGGGRTAVLRASRVERTAADRRRLNLIPHPLHWMNKF